MNPFTHQQDRAGGCYVSIHMNCTSKQSSFWHPRINQHNVFWKHKGLHTIDVVTDFILFARNRYRNIPLFLENTELQSQNN